MSHPASGGTSVPVPASVFATLAAAATSVLVVDMRAPDQPIVYCNAAFEALTGYEPASVLGRNCRFLQGPDTDPAAVEAIRQAIRDERSLRVELLNYARDGQPFWNELHLSPVHDDAGALTHYLGFQYDISERKAAVAVIASLQHAKLARMRELDRLKDEFLATVVHELRTPVHAMTGLIQLMQTGEGGPLTDVQRADLDALREHAGILSDMIADLLDLGQLQAGRLALRPEAIDLVAIAERTAALLRPLAASTGIALEVAGAPRGLAWGDARRMAQVVRNLVHNAIKASPAGTTVRIGVRAEGDGTRLEVADSGPGIPLADQVRVFERFVRLRPSGEGPTGAGLGLPICKGLVEASGGRIGVVSEAGGGSTFWCWLPAAPGNQAGNQAGDQAGDQGAAPTRRPA